MFTRRLLLLACTIALTLTTLILPLTAPPTRAAALATFDSHSKSVTWSLGRWWNPTIGKYNWVGIESDLDDMHNANITWVKTYFTRSTTYSVYDQLIPMLQARGINLQVNITSPRHYYLATDSAYKDDYKSWVAALVSRYKGYVAYWEIYNEPNLHYYWNIDENTTDDIAYANSVADYIALLKDSYTTIKAADPSAQVVLGGLASWKMDRFVDELIRQNAYQYFDIMGYHPYPDWSKPTPDGVIDQVNNLRAKMALQPEMASKPLWMTEVGFNTAFNDPGAVGHEGTKAAYLVDMMNKLRANGIVYPINWFNFGDNGSDPHTIGYDLVRRNTTTLQAQYLEAYYAYRDLWSASGPTTPPRPPADAATATFTPVADTYVDSSAPDAIFGSAPAITAGASPARITYITFDLSSLAGRTLDVVELKFKTAANADAGSNAQQFVKTCDTSWGEAAMNYSSRAALSFYTVGGGFMNTTSNTWYDVSLYPLDILPRTGQHLCLAIVTNGANGLDISSRETADPPQLIVTSHLAPYRSFLGNIVAP